MNDVMNNIGAFFQNVASGFQRVTDRFLSGLSTQHVGLILLILALIIIVLIILLALRGRKYNEAMDLIDQQVDAIVGAKRDAQTTIDRHTAEQEQRERRITEQLNLREQQGLQAMVDKEREFAEKHDELHKLRQFHDEYKHIDSAKAEIKRLMGEAHDYIDDVKLRSDREYAEIIGHAQDEANAIRGMSQGMMTRSHEMLKKALDRSREIIADAKREAEMPVAKMPDSIKTALRELTEIEQTSAAQGDLPAPVDVPEPEEAPITPQDELVPADAPATES